MSPVSTRAVYRVRCVSECIPVTIVFHLLVCPERSRLEMPLQLSLSTCVLTLLMCFSDFPCLLQGLYIYIYVPQTVCCAAYANECAIA